MKTTETNAAAIPNSPGDFVRFSDIVYDRLEHPIEVLYKDDDLVAVFKPAGLLVHRGSKSPTGEPVLLQVLRDQIARHVYPVHRLDQPTSGLILFALNPSAAASLVKQFANRTVTKYYQALVRGWTYECGIIRIPLSDQSIEQSKLYGPVDINELTKQTAESHYTTIRWYETNWANQMVGSSKFALVEIRPFTGRSHQIRRHLKHIAHPIIGDARHGDTRCNQLFINTFHTDRMFLTAKMIEISHPRSGQRLQIDSPRGDSMDYVIRSLTAFERTIDDRLLPPQPISQSDEGGYKRNVGNK